MRKSLYWLVAVMLVVAVVGSFSLIGCKEEVAEEEVEEVEEVAEEAEEVVEEAEESDKFVIGFCPRAFVSVFFVTLADAMEEEAAKYPDIDLQILSPVDQKDVEGQIKIVEDFTELKVDLLAVSVNDPQAIVPSLQRAMAAGIPILLIDHEASLEGVDELALIGIDNIEGGKTTGEWFVEYLDGKGRIVLIEGVAGQQANEFQLEGFNSVVDTYPDIEIVASQPADFDRAKALTVMENILQTTTDIDLVWGINDGMALGAIKAIEDAGLLDKIKVVGYNGDEEALVSIREGKLLATMLQQPKLEGEMVIDIARMIMDGKIDEVEPKQMIPLVPVTAENVNDWLE